MVCYVVTPRKVLSPRIVLSINDDDYGSTQTTSKRLDPTRPDVRGVVRPVDPVETKWRPVGGEVVPKTILHEKSVATDVPFSRSDVDLYRVSVTVSSFNSLFFPYKKGVTLALFLHLRLFSVLNLAS